jgi:hypothetical protein
MASPEEKYLKYFDTDANRLQTISLIDKYRISIEIHAHCAVIMLNKQLAFFSEYIKFYKLNLDLFLRIAYEHEHIDAVRYIIGEYFISDHNIISALENTIKIYKNVQIAKILLDAMQNRGIFQNYTFNENIDLHTFADLIKNYKMNIKSPKKDKNPPLSIEANTPISANIPQLKCDNCHYWKSETMKEKEINLQYEMTSEKIKFENTWYEKKLKIIGSRYEDTHTKNMDLENDIETYKSENSHLNKQLKVIKEKIDENDETYIKHEQCDATIIKYKSIIDTYENQHKIDKALIEEHKKCDDKIKEDKRRIDKLERLLQVRDEEVDDKNTKIEELKKHLDYAASEVARLTDIETKVNELEAKTAVDAVHISNLEKKISELETNHEIKEKSPSESDEDDLVKV